MTDSAALAIGFTENQLDAVRNADPSCVLIAVEGAAGGIAVLRSRKVQGILISAALADFTPQQFDELRMASPNVPKALVGSVPELARLEHFAAYADLSYVPADQQPAKLALALQGFLRPRALQRMEARFQDVRVTGTLGDRSFTEQLADLSNGGLSLLIQPGGSLDGFLPGMPVKDLRVVDSSGRVLLGPMTATARRTTRAVAGRPEIRVGLSFESPSAARPTHVRVVDDPTVVRVSLRKAASGGSSFTVTLPDAANGYRFSKGELTNAEEPVLVLIGPPPDELHRHDVVRLTFSHHGQSYSGLATIVGVADGLRLSLPRSLRVHHRRGSNRHRPQAGREYRVSLSSDLTGVHRSFAIHDINATGLSIIVDRNVDVLPVGLVVDRLELQLPDGLAPIVARGIVRSLSTLPQRAGESEVVRARCGIEILAYSDDGVRRLSQSLLADGFPYIESAGPDDFDPMWKLFHDSGFVAHLYADATPENLDIVRKGLGNLLGAGRPLGTQLLYREGGQIRGTVGIVQIYSNCVWANHIAAIQGSSAGANRISRALMMALAEYTEQHANMEFCKMTWNRAVQWPNRMFGWSARSLQHDGLSYTLESGVLARPNSLPPPEPAPGVRIDTPVDQDLHAIETYLLSHFPIVRIQSEDLTLNRLTLGEVNSRYRACGLFRERRLRVARLDGALAGFALIEFQTQGMQLSELTNAFEVFVLPETPDEDRPRVRASLIADAVRFYTSHGFLHTVAFSEDPDYSPFLATGFELKGVGRTWTFHRTQLRAFVDVWDQLFVNGRQLFGGRQTERSSA